LNEQTHAPEPQASADKLRSPGDQIGLPTTTTDTPQFVWAPSPKPQTSFIFYRMKDGAAWVIYTLLDGGSAIAAWPKSEEGWDEALPASIGTADLELGVYRAKDLGAAVAYLAPRSVAVRASTDPSEFGGH
jgi:hypothetical protein